MLIGSVFDQRVGRLVSPDEQLAIARLARAQSYKSGFKFSANGGLTLGRPDDGPARPSSIRKIRFEAGPAAWPVASLNLSSVPQATGPGLIILPSIRLLADGFITTPGIDPQLLRSALLLWDHLVAPINKILEIDIGDDARFLEKSGIIFRPEITMDGIWACEDLAKSIQFDTLRALLDRDHGNWSVAQGDRGISSIEPEQLTSSAIQFEIANAIPVPDKDVPIEEVLAFKAKRAAELVALQTSLAATRDAILRDPATPIAEHSEMTLLAKAVADQMAVSREWRFPVRLANFDHKIDAKTWSGAVASFEYVHRAIGLPTPLAIAGAAVGGAAVSVSMKLGWRGVRPIKGPYEYVWRYHRELF